MADDAEILIMACSSAGSSLGGGGPDSLLAIASSAAGGRASAVEGGSNPPDVRTVPHSRGKSDSFRCGLPGHGLVSGGDGVAIAAFFSITYQFASS